MARTIARIETRDGRMPLPPSAAFCVLEDGKPVAYLTVHELEDLALETLKRRHIDSETDKVPDTDRAPKPPNPWG